MRCERKDGAELLLTELGELEDDVRDGRVPLDAEVRFVPGGRAPDHPEDWPSDGAFHRVRDVRGLAPFIDAPAAQVADHLRGFRVPWAALAICGLVSAVFVVDVVVRVAGLGVPGLADAWTSLEERGAVGFLPSLVEGGWWTPWTASLLHVNALHLLMNLPILAYCGYRVERAMGWTGLLGVCAGAVAVATPLILYLSELPVVGASIMGFGLWGAQIALGLRLGDWIPRERRGNYGWGNLVFFIPLFLSGLSAEGVSHLGHFGGLLGGVTVAFAWPLVPAVPRAQRALATRRGLLRAGALAALPCLGVAVVGHLPAAMGFPADRVDVEGTGLSLELPARLAHHELRIGGLSAWSPGPKIEDPLFAGAVRVREGGAVDLPSLADWWHDHTGAEVQAGGADLPQPAPLGPGWQAYAFRLGPFSIFPQGAVAVEQVRTRGRWAWRVGYLVPGDAPAPEGLARWYGAVLASVVVGDPPELAAAKEHRKAFPLSPAYAYDLGYQLTLVDELPAAVAELRPLLTRTDGWEWDTMRLLLAVDEAHPDAVGLTAEEVGFFVERAPLDDLDVLGPGGRWLAAHKRCGETAVVIQRLETKTPGAEGAPGVDEVLASLRSAAERCVRAP